MICYQDIQNPEVFCINEWDSIETPKTILSDVQVWEAARGVDSLDGDVGQKNDFLVPEMTFFQGKRREYHPEKSVNCLK